MFWTKYNWRSVLSLQQLLSLTILQLHTLLNTFGYRTNFLVNSSIMFTVKQLFIHLIYRKYSFLVQGSRFPWLHVENFLKRLWSIPSPYQTKFHRKSCDQPPPPSGWNPATRDLKEDQQESSRYIRGWYQEILTLSFDKNPATPAPEGQNPSNSLPKSTKTSLGHFPDNQ